MKFSLALAVLLATQALAVPASSERMAARLERRRAGAAHQSQHNNRLISNSALKVAASNVSHVEYSDNWAGAIWDDASGTFNSVTGTFTVPTLEGSGAASAWVGLDGDTCESAILQTGVDFTLSDDGEIFYNGTFISSFFPIPLD
ncbi:hypothetical protein H0H87_001107 [Tephrocybe sp. NHM501043]|nr:hypothetical protein H0H87_001107 [Tephrocybe sp. NHM501043]